MKRLRDWRVAIEPLPPRDVEYQAALDAWTAGPVLPCRLPAGNVIPDWSRLVTKSNWQDAAEALHATNNFPELPGWLCPAPCERACVLAIECELVGHRRWLCRHRTAGVARRSRGRSQVATAHRFRRRRLRHDGRRRVCLWRHDTGSKPRRGAIADGRACAAAVDATLEGDTDRHPRGRSLRRNPERGH